MAGRTYRYYQGAPLYPFGYGLSYSKFEYSNLKLSTDTLQAGSDLTAEADVKNVSSVAGDEVAQLYLVFPRIPGAPLRALRGFERVNIPAGQTQHVKFTLNPRDLSSVEPRWRDPRGRGRLQGVRRRRTAGHEGSRHGGRPHNSGRTETAAVN